MAFNERIKIVIDVVKDQAGASLKSFKDDVKGLTAEVSKAEGFFGKAKAGVKGLGDMFKTAAKNPAVLASAVTAGAGAALLAADKFADLGIEVGKFATATGTSAETASRLIEVAGDVGVGADSLESAMGRMNKTAGMSPEVFDRFGVSIVHAKDGSVDASGTFLNVVDRLKAIRDPAEQAAAGTALLGKGWQDMSELVALGSSKLKTAMDSVSENKVFDDSKVAKARKYREVMDNLSDTIEDLALNLGEKALPAIVAVADALKDVAEVVDTVTGAVTTVTDKLDFMPAVLDGVIEKLTEMQTVQKDQASQAEAAVIGMSQAYDDAAAAVEDAIHRESVAAEASRQVLDDQAEAHRNAAKAAEEQKAAVESLYGIERRAIDRQYDYEQGVSDTGKALERYGEIAADSKTTQGELDDATRDVGLALADQAGKYATLEGASLDSEDGVKRQVSALATFRDTLAPGSPLRAWLDEYIAKLLAIPKNVDTSLNIHVKGATTTSGGDIIGKLTGARAAGGPVAAGGAYLVGEQGPEVFTPGTSGQIIPNGGSGGGVTINIYTGAVLGTSVDMARWVTDAIAAAKRRGLM